MASGDKKEATKISEAKPTAEELREDILRHLVSTVGSDPERAGDTRTYRATAHAVRDQLFHHWIDTQRSYYDQEAKRVYYLSMEFLIGRSLSNSLINLDLEEPTKQALIDIGHSMEELEELEWDAGLGNGGLGRLAACFLDSMAAMRIPAYGYGIRYDYGMFFQVIKDGYQVEQPDNWLRYGNPWQIERPDYLATVRFGGRVEKFTDAMDRIVHRWVDTDNVLAMPCDHMIPGYRNGNVINLRLWAAKSTDEFDLNFFQTGDYVRAVERRANSENISKVLYPSETVTKGRELRLKQEYFFVAATFQDIMRRFKKKQKSFAAFPDLVAIQLNDTHPAVAIPEMMRILLDREFLEWDVAWDICVRTFGYTNHTVMPEALEKWPEDMFGRILPRHLEIIYEINRRFLEEVEEKFPDDPAKLATLSIFEEGPVKQVRMANLAVVGSHSINGVSQIHTDIVKERVFKDFVDLWPERFNNKTNGVSPRRWLRQADPALADLITDRIGEGWITDLERLRDLEPLAEDEEFRAQWGRAKRAAKERLAGYIKRKTNLIVDVDSLFDVQVKRIHEYKRQVLNALHVITLYNRLRAGGQMTGAPRTVILAGKAAPGYEQAKLIIKLITSVADLVNSDPVVSRWLKVAFLSNYCVSSAEKIIPGADLSEQISTAGTEASGTGNMKLALNGALTIGTLDGANIEIKDAVGEEQMFIFGLNRRQVEQLKAEGYRPWDYYRSNEELKLALDMIARGHFSPSRPNLFQPLINSFLDGGDHYLVLADYRDYIRCQEEVGRAFLDRDDWLRRSILTTARMGRFSSDRTIAEYAEDIWKIGPLG